MTFRILRGAQAQRASSTSIAFQVNSDSTRTFGQAQSSSSDAVAEQLRQESARDSQSSAGAMSVHLVTIVHSVLSF